MEKKLAPLIIIITGLFFLSNQTPDLKLNDKDLNIENVFTGKWVRIGQTGPISLDFKERGIVEVDFGNDGNTDVVAEYKISHDTVSFKDRELQSCEGAGKYKIYLTEYYVSFDLIDDQCGGRIKSTMGFWVRPDFEALLDKLTTRLSNTPETNDYLKRARMYLAIGKPQLARMDLDEYIKIDSTNARAYINRAGTRFPNDFDGIVTDCNKAIQLEPNNKNAYFLSGLALYGLNKKEEACDNFATAIKLGFSVLRIAEKEKCADYWPSGN